MDQKRLAELFEFKLRNIDQAWNDYQMARHEVQSMPFKGIIELTENCNFSCIMCNRSKSHELQQYREAVNMPLSRFEKIADEFFPYAIYVDLRGFGESTILPYWPDILEKLSDYPLIRWGIVTNLSLPDPKIWERMIELNFAIGFSCEGADKHVFEAIRRGSDYEQILENLSIVTRAIKKHRRGFVYFISTIQDKNRDQMAAIVSLAALYGVQEVQFKMVQGENPFDSPDRIALLQKYSMDALRVALDAGVRITFNDSRFCDATDELVNKAANLPVVFVDPISTAFDNNERLQKQLKIMDDFNKAHNIAHNKRCPKPYSFMYINNQTEVGTCNHMMSKDSILVGDLKSQSLCEVWNSTEIQKFRQELASGSVNSDQCKWCYEHRLED